MKIALLSRATGQGGGASRVAENLTVWLRELGHEADLLVTESFGSDAAYVKPAFGEETPLFRRRMARSIDWFLAPVVPFDRWMGLEKRLEGYDVVHLHDHWQTYSPRLITQLAKHRGLFWTFHDCSGFTGGCMYPMGCEKFQHHCGWCPIMGRKRRYSGRDFTRWIRRERARQFKQTSLTVSTPSRWMAEMAKASGMLTAEPEIIPYGVDSQLFGEVSREKARQDLGLPQGRQIVLVSAHVISANNDRKGIRDCLEALKACRDLKPFVLLVGEGNEALRAQWEDFDFKYTGYVTDPEILSQWYASADVFLFGSKSDNFPMAVLESMSCRVATVAYAAGGIAEQVVDGVTGWLAPQGDCAQFAANLRNALQAPDLTARGEAARQVAVTQYDKYDFARAYLAHYKRHMQQVGASA
jgi:glycosyltransferase involved in cell wall biosynthesis